MILRISSSVTGGLTAVLLLTGVGTSLGQVVLDGKFGISGSVSGPNFSITAGMGATRGNNLFHSFTQFDLKAGDVATFSGPANIKNILSRVTGGSRSLIDGTIRSGIAGANFFFINPSGVMFGPNATVDVSGSFAASSANYLKLADGAKFVADLGADDSMLSTSPVVAFGFLNGANGSMEVRGSLTAGPGTSLSVLGSSVSVLEGARLEAINGNINLTSVAGPGEVAFASPSVASGVTTARAGAIALGAVSPNVVIRGGRLVLDNAQVNASTSGGEIDITMTKSVEIINGAQITTTSSGSIKGGNIVINSPSVTVDGKDSSSPTRLAAETYSASSLGAGGNIVIRSDSLDLRGGAEISVSSFGAADAGRVDVTTGSLRVQGSDTSAFNTEITANASAASGAAFGAGGEIVIKARSIEVGNFAQIVANTLGDANAGSINITAGALTLRDSVISTYSGATGNGGDIRIQSDHLTLDGPNASILALGIATGRAGLIDITAGSIRLIHDSTISSSTYGNGAGGNINITADSIVLDKGTPGVTSGISATSNQTFEGGDTTAKGGDISITTGSLALHAGTLISATTSTTGDGGSINISSGSVTLDGKSSIQSASLANGKAGTISVKSSQNVELSGGSTISTSALQSSGGNIRVQAGDEIRLVDSQITARAGPGGGGSVTLVAPSLIYLLNSTLTAQAVGDGGNLSIDPVFFILNNSSLISKSSSANGGNITILADFFFQSTSIIDASAPFGLPGTVSVSAPNVDLSGSLVGLPANLLDIETLLRPDCGVRLAGNISSFILLGRGGLPIAPGGFVPSGAFKTPDEGK